MSFDAFCYSTTHAEDIPGETQDETYAEKKAFEIISFELGAENNINIGSISGGGGEENRRPGQGGAGRRCAGGGRPGLRRTNR